MKTKHKNKITSTSTNLFWLLLVALILINWSCSEDDCEYNMVLDCPELNANIGDECEISVPGAVNFPGIVNEFCECIENQN